MMILDNEKDIAAFQMLAQYHAARLQLLGLKHSSGRSIIQHIRKTYGIKGNNESVVQQFGELLKQKGIRR